MKPIFCGNIEFDSRQSDLERLFRRYGRVERVDMKSGKLFFFLQCYYLCFDLAVVQGYICYSVTFFCYPMLLYLIYNG